MPKKPAPDPDAEFLESIQGVDGLMGYPTGETFVRLSKIAKARKSQAAAAGGVEKRSRSEKAVAGKVERKR